MKKTSSRVNSTSTDYLTGIKPNPIISRVHSIYYRISLPNCRSITVFEPLVLAFLQCSIRDPGPNFGLMIGHIIFMLFGSCSGPRHSRDSYHMSIALVNGAMTSDASSIMLA
jgi:hypothetical protein